MNVLIVDDEQAFTLSLRKSINWEAFGIQGVYCANSMKEAIYMLENKGVQILITDIRMPGGSGFDLLEWSAVYASDVLTIIISGFPDFRYAQRAIRLGVFEYILKPVNRKEFEQVLLRAVRSITPENTIEVETKENNIIRKAKLYIEDHINESISRDDVASAVQISPDYMSTLFRKETGITLSSYIRKEKIKAASQMLEKTNLPVSVIAQNFGYDSLAYFSANFKQEMKCTPREYRNRTWEVLEKVK